MWMLVDRSHCIACDGKAGPRVQPGPKSTFSWSCRAKLHLSAEVSTLENARRPTREYIRCGLLMDFKVTIAVARATASGRSKQERFVRRSCVSSVGDCVSQLDGNANSISMVDQLFNKGVSNDYDKMVVGSV
jgi:hypothetical protein